jgi:hypothetical protein
MYYMFRAATTKHINRDGQEIKILCKEPGNTGSYRIKFPDDYVMLAKEEEILQVTSPLPKTNTLEGCAGKVIELFPGETYPRWGIIEEISDKGFLVRIVKSRTPEYQEGDIVFYSNLTFRLSRGEVDKDV